MSAARARRPLLVVDGYNVIFKTSRYTGLVDDAPADGDPFSSARELLVADVAAYAQHRFDPVIVFDAAGNVSPERPNPVRGGVRTIFSETGESADTVIERLVTEARLENRDVTVVTSDNTIRATVGGIPVTRIGSSALVADIVVGAAEAARANEERQHQRMTVADRLDPETRARIDRMLGRR